MPKTKAKAKKTVKSNKERKGVKEIEVVNIQLTGADCSTKSYVNYNRVGNNYNGFFQFALSPSSIGGDSITIGEAGCNLEFNVICDDTIYSQTEKENIKFSIPVVDELAPDDALIEDIERIKEGANASQKFAEILDRLVIMFQNICKIKSVYSAIITVINIIGAAFAKCVSAPFISVKCKGGELSFR